MSGPVVSGLILGGLISLSIFVGLPGAFAAFWWLHPQEWAAIRAQTKRTSAWDMLLFRHIPVLREGK